MIPKKEREILQLSWLELKRFIDSYKNKIEDESFKDEWLTNRNYLINNGHYSITDIIEVLVEKEITQDRIEDILRVLGVEIVWVNSKTQ